MQTFKIIIAGSRSFNNYALLKQKMDFLVSKATLPIEVVSGMAEGADLLGRDWGIERYYIVEEFPAPWDDIKGKPAHEIGISRNGNRYWKLAGYHRNEQMAIYADACVLFWDGKSNGTKHMKQMAEKYEIPVKVLLF